jgi:hypothetical protein
VIVTTARIQATYLGGSRRTGTYGPRGARPGYTPPTRSTPGLGTCGAAEERRHWRRTRDRRSYKLHTAAAPVEDRGAAQATHGGGTGGGPGTTRRRRRWRTGASRSGTGGGPGPADIEGARSRSHGPAAERTEPGLGEPESTHCWTGTTCRAASLSCSDWSGERGVGRSRLGRVEGSGGYGEPGRAGRRPRYAVAGVFT